MRGHFTFSLLQETNVLVNKRRKEKKKRKKKGLHVLTLNWRGRQTKQLVTLGYEEQFRIRGLWKIAWSKQKQVSKPSSQFIFSICASGVWGFFADSLISKSQGMSKLVGRAAGLTAIQKLVCC